MDVLIKKPQSKFLNRPHFYVVSAIFIVVICIVAGSWLSKAAPMVERASIWIDTAKQGDMVREIRSSGRLEPRNAKWVTSVIRANVQEILVQPGILVKEDTIIIRLENPAVNANLEKAKAVFAKAEADLAAKKSELMLKVLEQDVKVAEFRTAYEISKVDAESKKRGFALGVIPKINYDTTQIILEQNRNLLELAKKQKKEVSSNIRAQLMAAEAQRDSVQGELLIAEQEAESLSVKAGMAGILQQINVERGQQISPGENIARVAQPTPLYALLSVPEVQAKDLTLGLKVLVDTRNGISEGSLTQINPAVKNGSVYVYVDFEKPLPNSARPDLSVEGRIIIDKIINVVSIARPSLALSNGEGKLFVVKPNSDVARKTSVHYGALSSDRVEITKGISAGEQVVISDISRWADYETIKLQ